MMVLTGRLKRGPYSRFIKLCRIPKLSLAEC
ncbi:hypothetical protein CUJ84_Chr001695 [Rhizobium leguminosarum]|uniref:Uncharacterized protein n=1 Tax=Rhizobium leguminosarum TaxID=384 RepID=A0A2K9Z1H0_RHILE|nr:hypothetical protein CUJ84_Chr001695 [Rhizobium leguminosarum]